jgi:hypothetical protein
LTKPEVFQFGNLIIETLVNYPNTLDQTKVKKLAKLIPAADNPTLVTDPDITIDRHTLQEKLSGIGDDKFEAGQGGERDLVADGCTQCPIT